MSKKNIVITIVLIALFGGGYYFFLNGVNDDEIVRAQIGTVSREIFETGSVKGGDRMNLSFKEGGRVIGVNVSAGDKVASGGILARLDDAILSKELSEARAALRLAETQLSRLFAGASSEEIRIAEVAVENAKAGLENAVRTAEVAIGTKYEEALIAMDAARINVRDTAIFVDDFQRDYFTGGDSGSISVRWARNYILSARDGLNEALLSLDVGDKETMDSAISTAIQKLRTVSESLETMIDVSESFLFRKIISETEVNTLKSFQSSTNASISAIVGIREAIANLKASADSSIRTAEGALNLAREELNRITAEPKAEDIELRTAEVERAQSRVAIFETRMNDTALRAPVAGQVTDVYKRAGEIVAPGEPVVSFISDGLFQVEADIYEGDVSRLEPGIEAEIKLVAFPGETFYGELISIDPTERVIDNVIYYRALIKVEDLPAGAKPSMTADIRITTDKKEEVVTLPRRVIIEEEGKSFVMVRDGAETRKIEIKVGIIGDDRTVEIVSGVTAGEEIVIPR